MPGHQTKTHHHHTDEHQCGLIFVLEMLQLPAGADLEKKSLKVGVSVLLHFIQIAFGTISAHSLTVGVMGIQKIYKSKLGCKLAHTV